MVNCVRRKPNISVALPLVAAAMLAALTFGQGAVHAQADDTIVFALTSEPTNLNPIFLDINAGNWKMFNGLIKFDQNLRPVPDLAREQPSVSDDGKIVTVKLRTDVHFHDGEPLTAQDVVFTWKAIVDPQVLTPIRAGLAVGDLIEDVQALDDYTVQFTLSRRDPAFIEKLYVGIVPSHLLAGEDLNTARFNRAPVGTGPFVFKEWTPGSRIVLEANPDYFSGPVGLDRVVYVFVSDENSRAAMLRSGTVDVARLSPRLAAQFEHDPRFQVVSPPTASISQATLPNDNPVLSDARVRRALAMAVDRQAIVDTIWFGMGGVAYSPILPDHWAYDEGAYIPYDPEGARALIREAGWTEGPDGFFYKDGQKLAFTMMYIPTVDEDRLIGLALRSYFADIGVDMTLEGVASPGYEERLHKDSWLHGVGLPYDPDYVFWSFYHSSLADDGDPTTNRARMRNAAVDAALEAGRTATDLESRREAYIAMQKALREDGSYLFLTQRGIPVVMSSRIQGVVPKMMGSPHAFVRGISWNMEDWSLAP